MTTPPPPRPSRLFCLFLFALTRAQCNWETEDNAPRIDTAAIKKGPKANGAAANGPSSLKAAVKDGKNDSSVSLSVPEHGGTPNSPLIRVSYLTEQTSHHPPVSAFHVTCPAKGITARGFDQITAKFTGTSVKVLPGEHNMGIFITLDKRDGETYQLTHPAAHLGGLLRGSLSVSVSEMAYFTCPKTKIKAILHYVEEGWLGRTTNKIDGVIFRYDPDNDTKARVQDVPDEDVLARLSGPWRERVIFTLGPRPVVRNARTPPCPGDARVPLTLTRPEIRACRRAIHHHRHHPPQRGPQDPAPPRRAAAQ